MLISRKMRIHAHMNLKTPKTPDHHTDDRGFLNYLVELDRIELTAS